MNEGRRQSQQSNDSDLLYGDNDEETPMGPNSGDEQTIVIQQSKTNPAQSNPASAAANDSQAKDIDDDEYAQFLAWKKMQAAKKAGGGKHPLALEKKPSEQPQAKKLILTDKEQKKYTEFLRIKKQCWQQYEKAINTIEKGNDRAAAASNSSNKDKSKNQNNNDNASNDDAATTGSAGSNNNNDDDDSKNETPGNDQTDQIIKHPFDTQFNDMNNLLNTIYEISATNFGKIIQIFESTDEKCNNQWTLDPEDDMKQSEMQGVTKGGSPRAGDKIDTIGLMNYNINFYKTYLNKVETFKRHLKLNLDTFKETLKQFNDEMAMESGNIDTYSYEKWYQDIQDNYGSQIQTEEFDVTYTLRELPPGTPQAGAMDYSNVHDVMSGAFSFRSQTNSQMNSRLTSARGNGPISMNNNNDDHRPPPYLLSSGVTPRGRATAGGPNKPTPGAVTVQPPQNPHLQMNMNGTGSGGYNSDGDMSNAPTVITMEPSQQSHISVQNHSAMNTFDSDLAVSGAFGGPGSRMGTIRDNEVKKDDNEDNDDGIVAKQISYLSPSQYSSVHFWNNDINSNLIICDFKIKNSEHNGTTVVFTPHINSLFKSGNKQSSKLGDSTYDDSVSGAGGSILSGSQGSQATGTHTATDSVSGFMNGVAARTEYMRIRMTKCDCNNQVLQKGGYNFQVGLICVPRDMSLLDLQNVFEKIKLKNNNCYLHNLSNKDGQLEKISTYYLNFSYFTTGTNQYRCALGKDEYRDYVTLYYGQSTYSADYCFKPNDSVSIAIEQSALKQYYLTFQKNNKLMGSTVNKNEFKNGKIKLNLRKYRYLFALSSIRCDCKKPLFKKNRVYEGFKFEVKIEGKQQQ